jgi:hypothetical protein
MLKDIQHHSNHYAALAFWLILGMLGFLIFGYSAYLQLMVVIFTATGYVVWGVAHHHLLHDLTAEIVLEYLIIAVFTVLLFGALLFPLRY